MAMAVWWQRYLLLSTTSRQICSRYIPLGRDLSECTGTRPSTIVSGMRFLPPSHCFVAHDDPAACLNASYTTWCLAKLKDATDQIKTPNMYSFFTDPEDFRVCRWVAAQASVPVLTTRLGITLLSVSNASAPRFRTPVWCERDLGVSRSCANQSKPCIPVAYQKYADKWRIRLKRCKNNACSWKVKHQCSLEGMHKYCLIGLGRHVLQGELAHFHPSDAQFCLQPKRVAIYPPHVRSMINLSSAASPTPPADGQRPYRSKHQTARGGRHIFVPHRTTNSSIQFVVRCCGGVPVSPSEAAANCSLLRSHFGNCECSGHCVKEAPGELVRSLALLTVHITLGVARPLFLITRKYAERYAEQYGFDTVLITRRPNVTVGLHVNFVVLFALRSALAVFTRVLSLDDDIMVHPTTPNVFAMVPLTHFGAVLETGFSQHHKHAWRHLKHHAAKYMRLACGHWANHTAYAKVCSSAPGLPVNNGFLVLSQSHRQLLDTLNEPGERSRMTKVDMSGLGGEVTMPFWNAKLAMHITPLFHLPGSFNVVGSTFERLSLPDQVSTCIVHITSYRGERERIRVARFLDRKWKEHAFDNSSLHNSLAPCHNAIAPEIKA